jgi:hypothetical protein
VRAGGGRSRACALVVAAVVLATTSGCGFLQDLAEPDEPPAIPVADSVPAAKTSAAGPVVVAEGALVDTRGGSAGRITVTVGPVQTGLVPPVPNFSDSCPVEPTSLQYVPVDVAFTGQGLAARLDVGTGPATPGDVGDVGIVVESGDGTERYCFDYPPLPTADRFWNQMGAATVTGYVVLDDAVAPATPDGRADVFPTLRLRISDLRVLTDPERAQRLAVGEMSVGAACPDDPAAICVSLG